MNEFERGKVIKIIEEGSRKILDTVQPWQVVEVKILTGPDRGRQVKIEYGVGSSIRKYDTVRVGDEVVLSALGDARAREYIIVDKFRLRSAAFILVGFFALIIVLSRLKGLTSILGLSVSIAVLLTYIVPSITQGKDPVTTTLIGSVIIVFVSIYLAHGLNKRTTIAVGSTVITLILSIILSYVFVNAAHLSGAGTEDAYALQFGQFQGISLKGLLLAGIIVGTLGVLDDITTSISAAVDEIRKANPNLNVRELYNRGISVGREHISSLVNTLVLAYAGTSMPIFIFFLDIADTQPLWVTLNTEVIIEEVIRTLVGSTALVLAVPITTLIAALAYGSKKK
jgi:uncharacterized membrane protein